MKFIKAMSRIGGSQVLIEDYNEYKEMTKELKIKYVFIFPGTNHSISSTNDDYRRQVVVHKSRFQNVVAAAQPDQQISNRVFSSERCFGFLENNTWFLCSSNGFSSFEEYDQAIAIQCHSKEELEAVKNGGYETYAELLKIQEKGFNSKNEFLEASSMGCDSKEEYTEIKTVGFADKNEYTIANSLGIGTKTEYTEYQEYEEFMKQHNLNTHDEVLLYKYLHANMSELDIESIKLTSLLPQLNRSFLTRRLKWFRQGISNYELFEKIIIEAKDANEYFYNKDLDIFQEKPIVFSNTEIVLDGSNIAWNNGSTEEGEKPLIRNVILVTKDLINKGFISIRIFFDANIEYDIDDKQTYKQLENTFNIKKVPAGQKADKYILDYAKTNKTYVISNDQYAEYINMDKWFEKNLGKIKVQFKIEGDKVVYSKTIEK
jgi:hypothetical protein